jgi:ornithine carbamoyltransferase
MDSKTVVMNSKSPEMPGEESLRKPAIALGINRILLLTRRRSACADATSASISDLTVQEMAAIMELSRTRVKNHPEDFRHALDARQMVMFFEKAS